MSLAAIRARFSDLYLADEATLTGRLIAAARPEPGEAQRIDRTAKDLVAKIRARRRDGGIDAFLQEYSLTSDEGVALMCLAEALLRVPDASTADKLIKDKIGTADWDRHRGQSESTFVNASTWALMLTGKVLKLEDTAAQRWTGALRKAVTRSGEPVIRQAMTYAMRIMGGQFVLGRTIAEALSKAKEGTGPLYRYSFDMLGEAAFTREDAGRYLSAYEKALDAIAAAPPGTLAERPSLSVKLSALHPRYEIFRKHQVMDELLPILAGLAGRAKQNGVALTIDAEEAERLELSLDLIESLARDTTLSGWNGLGLAVQAYQKRATLVLEWLQALADDTGRQLPVRLVKGAYWDSEIKRAQEQGLSAYPVFTRKQATDVSYLACMRQMLAAGEAFYPQFATHNAHSVASALTLGEGRVFEFQRLHGMGAPLYDTIVEDKANGRPCRVYAPVGSHEDLLAYLVRRLLENGANTSFVNRLADDEAPIADIVADPVAALEKLEPKPHPRIPLPSGIYAPRVNSRGALIADGQQRAALMSDIERANVPYEAHSLIDGRDVKGTGRVVLNPAALDRRIGTSSDATAAGVAQAISAAVLAQPSWDARGGGERAVILEKVADLVERDRALLIGLCIREAGKTLANGISDVREAIDFLRYYARGARDDFSAPHLRPGPTGERNTLSLHGRGVFACISPWNFPAAIFTGQIAAALAAGNAVVAKPAEQTPLIAHAIAKLFHEAGVPPAVFSLVLGDGPSVGAALTGDPRIAGVCFTGSTDVARLINRTLAARDGPIATLIAETGGLNAMIADSTALPEQLVRDALAGAFDSAGQRCSALRVLFVQDGIATRVINMLAGAMAELVTGDPALIETDIGPVIDAEALGTLNGHAERMGRDGKLIAKAPAPAGLNGHFFAPHAFEIDAMARLTRETFGPILHVVRYKADRLVQVCDAINATGYGLTLGIHTRIAATADEVVARVKAGNIYVNRNQIGAVVEAQPFGGEGLSGTGPKAGGPHYLHRFATERTLSVNTTAAGGNASLLSLGDAGT
jgi:RHH-type proline utilization regulon transcriptional repressor/proline dehydrogenase/delta 1-pyrroline-5-carboxylate dehydrogenase